MNGRLFIREFEEDEAIPPITALLHAAYGDLARQGFRYVASHQDDTTTERRLRSGFPFVAELDGTIVATATLYPPASRSDCAWYMHPGVYRFGQFAVRPALQQGGIGLRLLQELERKAREYSAIELALDTAEGAVHLRRWYQRLGFRFIQRVSWPTTNYTSVVLSRELAPVPG